MTAPSLGGEDRWLIAELLAHYAEAIDAGDFDAVGQLLAHATLADADGNPIATGAAAIAELYAATTRRHEDGTPRTTHVITNVIIDPLGPDLAELRSRFTVFQATDTIPLQAVVVGRYVDRVERVAQGWRFCRRVMVPEHWGDVSDHLSFDPRG